MGGGGGVTEGRSQPLQQGVEQRGVVTSCAVGMKPGACGRTAVEQRAPQGTSVVIFAAVMTSLGVPGVP